jgi:hypothetical protein
MTALDSAAVGPVALTACFRVAPGTVAVEFMACAVMAPAGFEVWGVAAGVAVFTAFLASAAFTAFTANMAAPAAVFTASHPTASVVRAALSFGADPQDGHLQPLPRKVDACQILVVFNGDLLLGSIV